MKKIGLILLTFLTINVSQAQFVNFNENGSQALRISTTGDAIDAHDGEIAYFDGVYYLYGTSYDCGFEWGNKIAPFCGFKVYASRDLKSWTYKGYLFDATTPTWQCRCDGKTYGCFRPHVVYNKKTQKYVLWVNVYDNRVGYRVFTAPTPTGPFLEDKEPTLAVNDTMPEKGLNNGDHDLFVDDDGTAYLAFTDWRTGGSIVIEKLSDNYLTGTGSYVKQVTPGNTEAPSLFKRNGQYYVIYSDPNCGYCSGTGSSYKTATSPLGPWSEARKISDNSCGGQPSFVSTLKINKTYYYIYGSDLWNNAAKNEALANYFWTPLTFDENGEIQPIDCKNRVISKKGVMLQQRSMQPQFSFESDISNNVQYMQLLQAPKRGTVSEIKITLFKKDYPQKELAIAFYRLSTDNKPYGDPVYVRKVRPEELGWSPNVFKIKPLFSVRKNERFCMTLSSATTKGSYGAVYQVVNGADNSGLFKSKTSNEAYTPVQDRILKTTLIVSND